MDSAQHKIAEGILFTDQYQFTMAQLYFRMGMHEKKAQFDYFFREYPNYGAHKAGYCVNAGLEWLLDWMDTARFHDAEIEFLAGQRGRAGRPVFSQKFLEWLRGNDHFGALSIRAIPEGRVVHQNVPLVVVQGPLAAAQILETSLLNHLNYQTLIATKAARIRESGRGQLFMEFGSRRGHGKGVNAGVRAALIGGADFSSNVGISHVLGYEPQGTHAHSMVQAFLAMGLSELDAFRAYADSYPDDCLLLVDTINTLESGIPNAIRVFEELKRKGHEPVGIRLDSGDLAHLAVQAAKMLDEAGFGNVCIVLSNELDELNIWQIITQIQSECLRNGLDADDIIKRLAYGVGTRLLTSSGYSALGGVYKLVALEENGAWQPAMKLSDTPSKIPNPGDKQVWRIYDRRSQATADLITLAEEKPADGAEVFLHHPTHRSIYRKLARDKVTKIEPLLLEIVRDGRKLTETPSIETMRAIRQADLDCLDSGVKRLMNPHIYHVSLSEALWELKRNLIESMRNKSS